MSIFMKASDDIKLLANRFKPLLDLADALEKIGGLEQSEREALVKKDAAFKAADLAIVQKNKCEAELEAAQKLMPSHNAKVELILNGARDKASSIVEEASAKAASILDEAKGKKSFVESGLVSARLEYAQLLKQIEDKKADLGSIQSQLDQMKIKISAFIN